MAVFNHLDLLKYIELFNSFHFSIHYVFLYSNFDAFEMFQFVNFAEQLTATRTFDVYDDNDYESYSSGTLDSILYLYFAFSLSSEFP